MGYMKVDIRLPPYISGLREGRSIRHASALLGNKECGASGVPVSRNENIVEIRNTRFGLGLIFGSLSLQFVTRRA